MDIWGRVQSLLGYQTNDDNIDSFGVDHSGFSLRDELAYQTARTNREQQLIQNYNNQGITKNYPKSGTNFWGSSPENNYGFGSSNIENNIENVTNRLKNSISKQIPQATPNYSLYGDGFSKEFIDEMLNNKEYQKALKEYAIPNEGGYVNNTKDPGGETNMGISKRYHPYEDIKNLTRERANALLYKEIWNWNGINKLPKEIRGFIFDHGIRTSPQNAIETTHRALGIDPVGTIIGNATLSRLENTDYEEFLHRYQKLVKKQDRNNKNYRYFGIGWDNRTNRYHITY